MSHAIDECYSVYNERSVRARTPKPCMACKETIRPGTHYTRVNIVFNGSAETVVRCWRCQRLHEHLRGLGKDQDRWPAERLDCGDSYEVEWGPVPEEIGALAFADANEPPEVEGEVE